MSLVCGRENLWEKCASWSTSGGGLRLWVYAPIPREGWRERKGSEGVSTQLNLMSLFCTLP